MHALRDLLPGLLKWFVFLGMSRGMYSLRNFMLVSNVFVTNPNAITELKNCLGIYFCNTDVCDSQTNGKCRQQI